MAATLFKKIADAGHGSSVSAVQYNIIIEKVSTIRFDVENIISEFYDRELDRNRTVWEDTSKLQITSAVLTRHYLLIFTNRNCYKIIRDKQRGTLAYVPHVQLIPEISWKTFFISSMKYVYLINDKDTHESGMSFFDLARIFDVKSNDRYGKKYLDLTMWL